MSSLYHEKIKRITDKNVFCIQLAQMTSNTYVCTYKWVPTSDRYAGRPFQGVPLLVTAVGKQHPDSHTLHCGRDQARSLCSHVHLLHVYLTPHKQCMWTGVGWMGYKPKFYHISLCMLERYCITCMLVFLFSSYPTPLQVSPCWGSYNWRAWGEWHDHDTLMEAKGLSSYHGCMVMGFT